MKVFFFRPLLTLSIGNHTVFHTFYYNVNLNPFHLLPTEIFSLPSRHVCLTLNLIYHLSDSDKTYLRLETHEISPQTLPAVFSLSNSWYTWFRDSLTWLHIWNCWEALKRYMCLGPLLKQLNQNLEDNGFQESLMSSQIKNHWASGSGWKSMSYSFIVITCW